MTDNRIVKYIKDNYDTCLDSGLRVREYLLSSSVAFHGRCVQTLHIPKVFSKKDIQAFSRIVDDFYGIFDKIIDNYIKSPEYRRLFPFSRQLEELILADTGYDINIPIMRMDIFYDEDTGGYKFCEINTDGTSAMIEDLELRRAFSYNNLPREFLGEVSEFELFDTWVVSLMQLYRRFKNRKKDPKIAIVDFLDRAYLPEFEEFIKRFRKYGFCAKICDIRELDYKNGILYDKEGERIDIIYRRAVTVDIMNNIENCQAFLDAYKDNAVMVAGGLRTQVIHHKALFYILRDPQTKRILTNEENSLIEEHIPYTAKMCMADKDRIIKDKDSYIIKPSDSYASRGVFAGVDCTQEEWEKIIREYENEDYIVQQYCVPYKTENIYLAADKPEFKKYSNLTGLYVYNSVFAGVYSRLSDGGIISSQYNEKSVATFVKKE